MRQTMTQHVTGRAHRTTGPARLFDQVSPPRAPGDQRPRWRRYDLGPGTGDRLTTSAFAIFFLVGSAVIALWLDFRFPRLGPETVKAVLIHVGLTLVAAQLLFPFAFHALGASRTLTLVAVFGVALPILTYSLLVAVWVLKLVANASRGLFR